MRIAWLADYTTKTRMGGAQLTNRFVIEEGKSRGHIIDELGLYNLTQTDKFLAGYDLYIINNYVEMMRYAPGKNLLRHIVFNRPFVKYAHDYDYTFDQTEEDREFQRAMYSRALAVGALSPLHAQELSNLGARRIFLACPYIDVGLFRNQKLKRIPNTVIGLGEIAEHKGIYEMMKWATGHKEALIDFYGFGDVEVQYFNLMFHPAIPYDRVPLFLNMYESFIHLPKWKEPFGRTVAEAFLCGCKMITNENVGFGSYKITKVEDIELLVSGGPMSFWREVEKL